MAFVKNKNDNIKKKRNKRKKEKEKKKTVFGTSKRKTFQIPQCCLTISVVLLPLLDNHLFITSRACYILPLFPFLFFPSFIPIMRSNNRKYQKNSKNISQSYTVVVAMVISNLLQCSNWFNLSSVRNYVNINLRIQFLSFGSQIFMTIICSKAQSSNFYKFYRTILQFLFQ